MKIGQYIHILAILFLIIGFVQPVPAAGNETGDAATAAYNAGVILLEEKEYLRAILAFDQALASDTTMINQSDALLYTYQNKAYALIQLNNCTAAIQTLDQGLALYSKDEKLWYNKGYALSRLGNYPEALNAYDKVLQINNASLPALNMKGDTLFQMGRYQDAVDAYTRANALEPNDSYSLDGLAKAKSAAGTADQTILIILLLILVVVAGGIFYYVKYRKPEEERKTEKKPEKKSKGKKK
ncbi:MAG: tetratricopeptide repeat protein [Methanoregula sp.]|jgi:tetratricopeptide (TPR) repeat protein|nr:tetratricopeptide repeat protein [Methanoregula sp.]